MKPTTTLIAALAIAASTFAVATPAAAQEATAWPELMMKMADRNKDGMVTRQEFLDHMAKMWDEKHGAMMKTDKSMKAGMMDKAQFMSFVRNLLDNPGKIGG